MKSTPPPQELVVLFNAVIPVDQAHRVEPRKTLGYPSCFIGGHMFMCLFQDQMVVRLSEEDRDDLIAKGGKVFEPVPGRVQKEFVVVPNSVLENQTALRDWVARAYSYGGSLPPKEGDAKSESHVEAADPDTDGNE